MEIPEGFDLLVVSSPFTELIGPFGFRNDERGFVLGMRLGEQHLNRGGRMHGGVAATIADVALSRNVIERSGGTRHVTASLTVDFVAGADVGDWVEATATVTRTGRKASFATAAIFARGRQIAQASGVFVVVPGEPFTD